MENTSQEKNIATRTENEPQEDPNRPKEFVMTSLTGRIFGYNDFGSVAFTNDVESKKCVIFIGGLGGNLCSPRYLPELEESCRSRGINLAVIQLQSNPSFTTVPIERDVENIKELIDVLSEKYDEFILMGHSTGCQDSLLFLKEHFNSGYSNKIKGVVLQAPVSDVEGMEIMVPDLKEYIKKAEENKYVEFDGQIYLSERFLSLYRRNGSEDLFSSWISVNQYAEFKNYCRILSLVSSADEYCFVSVQDKLKLFGDVVVIEGAGHSVKDPAHQVMMLGHLEIFFASAFTP